MQQTRSNTGPLPDDLHSLLEVAGFKQKQKHTNYNSVSDYNSAFYCTLNTHYRIVLYRILYVFCLVSSAHVEAGFL